MAIIKKSLAFIVFILSCVSGLNAKNPPQLGVNSIDEVLASMTLEEKATLLAGSGATTRTIPDAAGYTAPIPRLGIPATVFSDGPAGLRIRPLRDNDPATYFCTGFPCGVLLASSWDTQLVSEIGRAMGNEVKEYGVDVLLGPGVNILRNPLNGRNFEYFSEDPLQAGKLGAAMVKGLQSMGIGACVKHFAANNQEKNRGANDAHISQRALREIYLKPFEICVKESNPWTIMSSYNRLNGDYTQENFDLLTLVLRNDWLYKGMVMTDWSDPKNTSKQVHAGNDLMMPGYKSQSDQLVADAKSGKLAEKDVDACVRRMLEYIVKTPSFKNYQYSNKPDLKEHARITRISGGEGMVLLKNDAATLPLNNPKQTISLFGATSYQSIAGGTGSGNVNKPYIVDISKGLENAGFALDPLLNRIYTDYRTYQNVKMTQDLDQNGWPFISYRRPTLPEMEMDKALAERQAAVTDLAVVTLGRNSGEGTDRTIEGDFNLTQTEESLLKSVCDAFHAKHKKVVVVLNIGSAIETASWKNLPDAVVVAWIPGMEVGNAVADVLTGKTNPSGRLPMTFPVNYSDLPSSKNFPVEGISQSGKNVDYTDYEEDIWVGYRYFSTAKKEVSYPFGYGLSYTTFSYANAKLAQGNGQWKATVKLTNTGNCPGKEVVQLYIKAPASDIKKPACELKAFAKTKLLAPGESQVVTMTFNVSDLASYHESSSSWVADKGSYTAFFAASVADVRQHVSFKLAKTWMQKTTNALAPKVKINRLEF
ncbi:MAG: glycoside hydrolase family 3 C-terminal domain-containing protein [Bacteroidota bacterium]|nr:glycoside hydrolase family 3 C-terminal domain-containing protein [Bacteroidota bacterium]